MKSRNSSKEEWLVDGISAESSIKEKSNRNLVASDFYEPAELEVTKTLPYANMTNNGSHKSQSVV